MMEINTRRGAALHLPPVQSAEETQGSGIWCKACCMTVFDRCRARIARALSYRSLAVRRGCV